MVLPTVTAVSPVFGSTVGGISVTVTGSGFSVSVPAVFFGGVQSPSISVTSDTVLVAVTPVFATAATVFVTVETTAGTSLTGPGSVFYYLKGPVPDGAFSVVNPWFDPGSNYVVFGTWTFEGLTYMPGLTGVAPSTYAIVQVNTATGQLYYTT